MFMMPPPQALLPSMERRGDKFSCDWNDFTKLIYLALQFIPVDEEWYLSAYPDVVAEIESKNIASASDHFRRAGYLEGRFPIRPVVDEAWYLKMYPDVREAIARGVVVDAQSHFVSSGYQEGRMPCAMPVDSTWYEAANPQSSLRKMNGESCEEDFIRFGFREGFMPYRPDIMIHHQGEPWK
jgi:hypothetical protein